MAGSREPARIDQWLQYPLGQWVPVVGLIAETRSSSTIVQKTLPEPLRFTERAPAHHERHHSDYILV
jgi:hypothetical protein